MAGGEADFDNAASALLALASEGERIAYERELAKPPQQNEYGEEIRDTSVQDTLLPKLIEKLRSGEWVASGFGFESGQPTEIHPRLWQRLFINVQLNSANDSMGTVGYKSATGSFHSLGFAQLGAEAGGTGHAERVRAIAEIAKELERLDKVRPLSDSKAQLLHEASQIFELAVKPAWLREGWTKAELNPARKRAGLKKIN